MQWRDRAAAQHDLSRQFSARATRRAHGRRNSDDAGGMGRDPRGSVGAAGFQPEECHRTYQFARLVLDRRPTGRSEEHTSELQSLMRISYAVFCLKQTHQLTPSYATNYL